MPYKPKACLREKKSSAILISARLGNTLINKQIDVWYQQEDIVEGYVNREEAEAKMGMRDDM